MLSRTLLLPAFVATAFAGSSVSGIVTATSRLALKQSQSGESNGRGELSMAAIPTGRRTNFAMQTAAASSVTRTGCLLYKENHFILQDNTTQEVVELNGPDLALNAGNRVAVTGTAGTAKPVVTLATSVVNVTSVAPRSRGGCITVASTLGASTEAPASGATPAVPQTSKPAKTAEPRKSR